MEAVGVAADYSCGMLVYRSLNSQPSSIVTSLIFILTPLLTLIKRDEGGGVPRIMNSNK